MLDRKMQVITKKKPCFFLLKLAEYYTFIGLFLRAFGIVFEITKDAP